MGNFHKDVVNVQIFQLYPPCISIMILPLVLTVANQCHVTVYTNEHTVAERKAVKCQYLVSLNAVLKYVFKYMVA